MDASDTKKVQKFGGDVELNELGQIRRAICCEGVMHEDVESDSRQLEEAEEGRQVFEGSGEVTWVMRPWKHADGVNVDVHVDSDWANGLERKIDKWGHDDHQRHTCGNTGPERKRRVRLARRKPSTTRSSRALRKALECSQ